MPRKLRTYSLSKTYHIIFRGLNKQNIFYDDQDKRVFLKKLIDIKTEFYFQIFAYCLMINHVHLVIRVEDEMLSKGMKSLLIRYSSYFNKKYERIGTFVQDRFKSKNIENQKYFLDVCRYVHRNPENALICKTKDYEWSSYKEYISENKSRIIDKEILLAYFNNDINEFINFTTKINHDDIDKYADFEIYGKLNDDEVLEIIINKFNLENVPNAINFFKKKDNFELKQYISKIKNIEGISLNQISRIFELDRGRLRRIWE